MIYDFTFHVTHRAFHCNWKYLPLYQKFHKMHHEFTHTISIAFTYAHPVEFLICNLLPLISGILILGQSCHFITFAIWLNISVAQTLEGHSGYEFPLPVCILLGHWFKLNPFLSPKASYHDFHHSRNVGNYSGFYTIWDTVFNCNGDYYAWLTEEEANQTHENDKKD